MYAIATGVERLFNALAQQIVQEILSINSKGTGKAFTNCSPMNCRPQKLACNKNNSSTTNLSAIIAVRPRRVSVLQV